MSNKKFLQEILEAKEIDQEIRRRAGKGDKNIFNFLYYIVDRLHNYIIERWISRYGYPTRKKVGEEGMRAFWILVMHQFIDSGLQKQCLKHCDFGSEEKAKLTDRILALRGKKQVYGTFVKVENGKYILYPVKDVGNAERMRKNMGLPPIKKYLATLNVNKKRKNKKVMKLYPRKKRKN